MPFPELVSAEELEITFPMGRWTYTRKTWPSNDGRPVFEESPQRQLCSNFGKWELHGYFCYDDVMDGWKRLRDDQPVEIKIVVTKHRNADPSAEKNELKLGQLLLKDHGSKDVELKIDDKVIMKAHSTILAATCPAWKMLLNSGMEDAKAKSIDVFDCEPASLRAFVTLLYTNDLPKDKKQLA